MPTTSQIDEVPVVGVGASAGGLDAFTRMLRALPADPGSAFVLIQHLAPEHASLLTGLLERQSAIPIIEAKDGARLEANHVYVVTPGTEIRLVDGRLAVTPRQSPATIDLFFRSLAMARGSRAVGVVLSGTGSDGTLGLMAIRQEGGVTFAQEPGSCAFDGMPLSAIAAGAVDTVLAPEDIARDVARVLRHPYANGGMRPDSDGAMSDQVRGAILTALQSVSGVDFADYKPATLVRRVLRRMAILSITRVEDYCEHLASHPGEAQALYEDVLIHVTSFFRDPAAFEALAAGVFPAMLRPRSPGDGPVKIWVPGCASGEEAFSLVIAVLEYQSLKGTSVPFQIFATDLHDAQITKARRCWYPETIAQDVSPDRLRRFFTRLEGGYQISPAVRERCVFAQHNLLVDPPFSQNDLVSCRNVLIYYGTDVQRRLVPMFHYALKPGGHLLLGASESIGAFERLFEVVDARHKIFQRTSVPARLSDTSLGRRNPVTHWPPREERRAVRVTPLQRRLDDLLLRRFAPPAVVVNAALDIVQFRGDSSAYLVPASGAPSLNVLGMAREGLQLGLRDAVQEALTSGRTVTRAGLWVRGIRGGPREVTIEVTPLSEPGTDERYALVLFEEPAPAVEAEPPAAAPTESRMGAGDGETLHRRITELEGELSATSGHLQGIIASSQLANDELQTLNEEVVSSNEELQSVNEELETAKEELQSSNEELSTVNDELRHRNVELVGLHDDLTNILVSVGTPLLVVDAELRIRRVSAGAQDVFLGSAPLPGTRLQDFRAAFNLAEAAEHMQPALTGTAVVAVPVLRADGRRFLLRGHPYRTTSGRIDGCVLMIIDVEEMEGRVAQRTAELQVSNDQMMMFSYSISHDLRAPLRAMRGYAEALLEDAAPLMDEAAHRYCAAIVESAERLDHLILSLLDFSRAGIVQVEHSAVDLAVIAADVVRSMEADLADRRARVLLEFAPSLPPLQAHPATLAQVVRNLIENAVKFVPIGLDPRVLVRGEQLDAVVRVWVEDNGIGIAPQYQDRIFGVFERLHTGAVYPGVGIGLAYVKRSIERMGGAVGLDSTPNQGSRFWFELPTGP